MEEDSTDLFMQKMKEAGLESNPEEEVKKPDEQSRSLAAVAKDMGKSVIQRYMTNPLLVRGKKFDFRSYLFIACVDPFITFFNPGYVRYSLNDFTMNDFGSKEGKITHLTNNSV